MTSLALPYPAAEFEPGEVAPERTEDGVTCVCGNVTEFSAADRSGRYASILDDSVPRPAELGQLPLHEAPLAVCNRCGRVYDDAHLDRERFADSPVLARIDLDAAEARAARALYDSFNFDAGHPLVA